MFYLYLFVLFSISTGELINTFGENNFMNTTLFILSDFNYEICSKDPDGTYCHSSVGDQCKGGIRRLNAYIENERMNTANSFFIGAGSFFDQERFSILHYKTLVDTLDLLQLDVINLDAEVFHHGMNMATDLFLNNNKIGKNIVSVNLPEVPNKYIKKEIVHAFCPFYFIGFESKFRADSLNIPGLEVNEELDSIKDLIKEIKNREEKPIFFLVGPADLDTAIDYLEEIPEVSVIILDRYFSNISTTDPVLFSPDSSTSWILGIDHRMDQYTIGVVNFTIDIHECKLMNYSGEIVEILRNDTAMKGIDIENKTATILLKEYNQLGKTLSRMRTNFSNTENITLESTISDAIYYYVNSELQGDWPEPIAGAIVNSQVINKKKRTILKGPLTIDDIMPLINNDFICKFWANFEKLTLMFKFMDFNFSLSSSMKITLSQSFNEEPIIINFELLWEDNTYHQLYLWSKDVFPWFAPCNLFENSNIQELFKNNYTIYEITLMDVLRKYIYKPSENDLFIPSFYNSRIQYISKESSNNMVIPFVASTVGTAVLIIGTWIFWRFCLKTTCSCRLCRRREALVKRE